MKFLRALAVVGVFALLLWLAVADQRLPAWVMWLATAASLIAVILYAVDKRAAIRGEHRIAASTLQLAAVAGGWPGALLAQSMFRHKTVKRAFQRWFWCAVTLNCAALAWFALR